MGVNNNYQLSAYGLTEPLINVFNSPIIAKRAPLTSDSAPLGTLWIWPLNNDAWVLTSVVANVATWSSVSGGTGDFSALTIAPGPTSILGTTTINNSGAGTTTVGTGGTGVTSIGNITGGTSVSGTVTVANGSVVISTATQGITLPGPTRIINGAGVPAGALAINVGDIYINKTAASATTRVYCATVAGTWTNFTMAA